MTTSRLTPPGMRFPGDDDLSELSFVPPDERIDLTNCDREPIHIPGAVQSHGALLVLREPDLVVTQASANTGALLGVAPERLIGARLADWAGEEQAAAILAPLARGESRAWDPVTVTLGGDGVADGATGASRTFDGVVHRADGMVLLELEPQEGESTLPYHEFYRVVHETIAQVERAESLVGLAHEIAAQMRRITGFDRVWVYRFHEDWHGEIIAEAKRDDIETWLGMHYPASDIPAQARALFLRHWLRMIPDVGFAPVPLVPVENPDTRAPLDMGGTVLRSVSPIHIQYLQNMGVRASLVVSLVRNGRLWGLISGHHYSGPRRIPYALRTVCEFLAQAFSSQVGLAERAEDREHALGIGETLRLLVSSMGKADRWVHALVEHERQLLRLTGAGGAALCVGDEVRLVGETPPADVVRALRDWLATSEEPVLATSALPARFPAARPSAPVASGLLAVHVGATQPDWVLWFRPESRQQVKWAGDPRKPVMRGEDGVERLSPRGSFELWEATVKETSAPWGRAEVDAAVQLRDVVRDVLLRRAGEVEQLNAELERFNAILQEQAVELEAQAEELRVSTQHLLDQEEEREELLLREREARQEAELARRAAEDANRAKAEFLAMMSHELRTPLNAIGGYADLMAQGIRGAVTEAQQADLERIQVNQRHLLGLINSILNFARLEAGQVAFDTRRVVVDELLSQVEALVMPQVRARGLHYAIHPCAGADGGPLAVRADPEKVRQIVLNLVSNAIKFTDAGGITIRCAREGGRVQVTVADTGRGIPAGKLAHVFEPFVQVDRHLTEATQQGIGLGLAISRDLARRMGGDLVATSVEGEGSAFTLTLPEG